MPESSRFPTRFAVPVAEAITSAAEAFFQLQCPDGSWQVVPGPGTAATAAATIALHLADPVDSAELIRSGVGWLRARQSVSGGWGDEPGSPPTFSATAFAAACLQLVAPVESAAEVRRALGWIDGHGGLAAGVARRQPLHLAALDALTAAGLRDRRLVLPVSCGVRPLWALRADHAIRSPLTAALWLTERHARLDRPLGPLRPLRRLLLRRAEARALTALDRLTPHPRGGRRGHGSPLMAALHCIALVRVGVRPDLVERLVAYLWLAVGEDGSWPVQRDLDLSATTLVARGLHDAGYTGDRRLERAMEWIGDSRQPTACEITGAPPGGWSSSAESGPPDAADTAEAVLALSVPGHEPADPGIGEGLRWLLRTQNSDGSWNCCGYEHEHGRPAPSPVATAKAVKALRRSGGPAAHRPVARAIAWLARTQLPDGSHQSPHHRGRTAGTAHVLSVLGECGLAVTGTARLARQWLLAHQNEDGGWGDGEGSASSVEETSWSALALLATGRSPEGDPALTRAVDCLLTSQLPNGLWKPAPVTVHWLGPRFSDDMLASGLAIRVLGGFRSALRPR